MSNTFSSWFSLKMKANCRQGQIPQEEGRCSNKKSNFHDVLLQKELRQPTIGLNPMIRWFMARRQLKGLVQN